MKTRSVSTDETTHVMLPYVEDPIWIHISDLYNRQHDNLFETMMETKYKDNVEKATSKWAQLGPTITKKRIFEKRTFVEMQQKSKRCAFLEEVPEYRTISLLSMYVENEYDWIQRIRFAHVRSHVRGVCDALIRKSFLSLVGMTIPEDYPLYTLVLLKPAFHKKQDPSVYDMEIMMLLHYFGNMNPTLDLSPNHVLIIGKDTVLYQMKGVLVEDMYECVRTIRKIKKWSSLIDENDSLPPQLLPNMKSSSTVWVNEKREVAIRQGEITLLWKCNLRERRLAFSKGVTSWRDERFSPSTIDWTNPNDCFILERILKVNRSEDEKDWLLVDSPSIMLHVPEVVHDKVCEWFIDFEYVGDFIYLIGIFDGQTYISLWADELSTKGSQGLWDQFQSRMDNVHQEIHCWYWYAEEKMIHKLNLEIGRETWLDLWQVCRGCAVRGAFDFSLKSWVHAFHKHGTIPFQYNELECQNGASSIHIATNYYENKSENESLRSQLERYNRYDCEAMYYILSEIRSRMDD